MNPTKQIKRAACVLPFCIAAAAFMIISGCKNGMSGFKKTASGLQYKIIDDESGDPGKTGDYMKIQLIETIHDSTVFDTHHAGGPLWKKIVQSNGQPYDLMEGFALLSKGDSAEFVIPVDSVMKSPFQRPPFVKKGDMIRIFVKVLDVKDEQGYQSALATEKKAQLDKDDQIIKSYLDSTHQSATPTENGVYVIRQKEGSGPLPQDGQEVTVMYTGKTLDGKVFDSNEDSSFHHTQPLSFVLGQQRMIPGMEEGVKTLKKGAVATLIIPSGEAYGPRGRMPAIKPNAVLIFDVKVTGITGTPETASGQSQK